MKHPHCTRTTQWLLILLMLAQQVCSRGMEGRENAELLTPDSIAGRTKRMKVLDAESRIFLYTGFLSPDECDELIELAAPRLEKMRYWIGGRAYFEQGENYTVVRRIEQRIADWVMVPLHNCEGLCVSQYRPGKKFSAGFPHWDNGQADGDTAGGCQYATVVVYLNDVDKGGETIFPLIPAPGGENLGYSECARRYLAVKPRKGDALLFHGVHPSGAIDRRVMHDACPVEQGTKWSMQQFIRVGRYSPGSTTQPTRQTQNPAPLLPMADCSDEMTGCVKHRLQQCYLQKALMVGNATHPGQCLATCMRCDIWRAHLQLRGSSK